MKICNVESYITRAYFSSSCVVRAAEKFLSLPGRGRGRQRAIYKITHPQTRFQVAVWWKMYLWNSVFPDGGVGEAEAEAEGYTLFCRLFDRCALFMGRERGIFMRWKFIKYAITFWNMWKCANRYTKKSRKQMKTGKCTSILRYQKTFW